MSLYHKQLLKPCLNRPAFNAAIDHAFTSPYLLNIDYYCYVSVDYRFEKGKICIQPHLWEQSDIDMIKC